RRNSAPTHLGRRAAREFRAPLVISGHDRAHGVPLEGGSLLLANKTVLITGGTAGIGVALARVLKGRSVKVLVCGRDRERLEALAREGFFTIRADVGTDEGRAAILDAGRKVGGFDVLVNNAGVQSPMDFRKPVAIEQVRAELDTNLAGPILLSALALPLLL